MTTAYDLARTKAGLHEQRDEAALRDYLYTGGQNLSPATRAWCADFVNASLTQSGQSGTNSGAARSFLSWGQSVSEPRAGDLVVLSRGDPKGWQGHVGFYEGKNEDGSVRVFGGNQSNQVGTANYPATQVLGYRRAGESGGIAGSGEPPAATVAPEAAPRVAEVAPPKPSTPSGGRDSADTALGLASAVSKFGQPSKEPDDILQPVGGRGIGQGAQRMAAVAPYGDRAGNALRLARADGGVIDKPDGDAKPDPRGAGRFAAPQLRESMPQPDTTSLARRLVDRVSGVGRLPYADGGGVGDTGMNLPETRDSLMVQQRQLI